MKNRPEINMYDIQDQTTLYHLFHALSDPMCEGVWVTAHSLRAFLCIEYQLAYTLIRRIQMVNNQPHVTATRVTLFHFLIYFSSNDIAIPIWQQILASKNGLHPPPPPQLPPPVLELTDADMSDEYDAESLQPQPQQQQQADVEMTTIGLNDSTVSTSDVEMEDKVEAALQTLEDAVLEDVNPPPLTPDTKQTCCPSLMSYGRTFFYK